MRIDDWINPVDGYPTVNPIDIRANDMYGEVDNEFRSNRSGTDANGSSVNSVGVDYIRAHAGTDYHTEVGREIYAMTDGIVESVEYFYLGTYVINVKNTDETIIRYGELANVTHLVSGTEVKKGDLISTVIKNTSSSSPDNMLHMEMYKGVDINGIEMLGAYSDKSETNWLYCQQPKSWQDLGYQRRSDLLNPDYTVHLKQKS